MVEFDKKRNYNRECLGAFRRGEIQPNNKLWMSFGGMQGIMVKMPRKNLVSMLEGEQVKLNELYDKNRGVIKGKIKVQKDGRVIIQYHMGNELKVPRALLFQQEQGAKEGASTFKYEPRQKSLDHRFKKSIRDSLIHSRAESKVEEKSLFSIADLVSPVFRESHFLKDAYIKHHDEYMVQGQGGVRNSTLSPSASRMVRSPSSASGDAYDSSKFKTYYLRGFGSTPREQYFSIPRRRNQVESVCSNHAAPPQIMRVNTSSSPLSVQPPPHLVLSPEIFPVNNGLNDNESDKWLQQEIEEEENEEVERRNREKLLDMMRKSTLPRTTIPKYSPLRIKKQAIPSNTDDYVNDVREESLQSSQVEESSEDSIVEGPELQPKTVEYYLNNFGALDNPIIFSGELYRFKPGIQNNFISRWFQISTHAFRYFKNYYSSHGNSKPLVAIPNAAVIKIVPFTEINKEAFVFGKRRGKNEELEKRLMENMFEVVLYDDYESIYLYREIDAQNNSNAQRKTVHPKRISPRLSRQEQIQLAELAAAELEHQQRRVSYRPQQKQSGFLTKTSKIDLHATAVEINKSNSSPDSKKSPPHVHSRQTTDQSRKSHALFGNQSTSAFNSAVSYQQKLMNSTSKSLKGRLSANPAFLSSTSVRPKTSSTDLDQQPLDRKVTRIVQGHLVTVRDLNKGKRKSGFLEDASIVKKEFGTGHGEQKAEAKGNVSSWTNRQLDWYNSERRLIFAIDPLSPAYSKIKKEFFLINEAAKQTIAIPRPKANNMSPQQVVDVWTTLLPLTSIGYQ